MYKFGLILTGLFALTAVAVYSILVMGFSKITVTTLPDFAVLTQPDSHFTTRGTQIYLREGVYLLEAKSDGFDTARVLVDTQAKSEYITQLNPRSDDAQQWYRDNIRAIRDYESLSGRILQEEGEAFRRKNPIINNLPYTSYLFSIGYKRDLDTGGDAIVITIDASDIYIASAIQKIRQWGYEPSELSIQLTQENDREFKK